MLSTNSFLNIRKFFRSQYHDTITIRVCAGVYIYTHACENHTKEVQVLNSTYPSKINLGLKTAVFFLAWWNSTRLHVGKHWCICFYNALSLYPENSVRWEQQDSSRPSLPLCLRAGLVTFLWLFMGCYLTCTLWQQLAMLAEQTSLTNHSQSPPCCLIFSSLLSNLNPSFGVQHDLSYRRRHETIPCLL